MTPALLEFTNDILPKGSRGIDVAGSHGDLAKTLYNELYTMSVLDLPSVVNHVKNEHPELHWIGHDILKDKLNMEQKQDFATLIRFIHMHNMNDFLKIVENLQPSMQKSHRLLIVDTFRKESPFADVVAVNMAVNTPRGNTYTSSELAQALPEYDIEQF